MLVEIRIGPGKQKLKNLITEIKDGCRIPANKIHRVPHISLFGSFSTSYSNINKIAYCISSVCRKYSLLRYQIDGFKWLHGEKGTVIYLNIAPSEELKQFRKELRDELSQIASSNKYYDKKDEFTFHATVAYKLTKREFDRVWDYLSVKRSWIKKLISFIKNSDENENITKEFYLPMNALRITFLNDNSKIVYEYDLLQKKLLSRREALSRYEWAKTLRLFRLSNNMENCKDNKKSIYLISDLHLDHSMIIQYCARPFPFPKNPKREFPEEMNNVLIANWNNTVRNNPVYFLGDLRYGRGSRPAKYWLKKLSGEIHFIRGNHEEDRVENSKTYNILKYKNYKFLLVHDPEDLPIKWDGWTIHGHVHNNNMKKYPFINGERKTINVSAELLNYKPVSMDFLMSLDLDNIKRMDTVTSKPILK